MVTAAEITEVALFVGDGGENDDGSCAFRGGLVGCDVSDVTVVTLVR